MTLDEAIKETAKVLQQYVEGCDEFDAGVQVLAAARSWHTLTNPDYEAALSDLLELVPDAVLADAVRIVDAALVWEKQ